MIETTVSETILETIVVNETGPQGIQGEVGVGVAAGGTTAQVLVKTSNNNYETQWVSSVAQADHAVTSDNATNATHASTSDNATHATTSDTAGSVQHTLTAIAGGTKTFNGSADITIGSVPALGTVGQVLSKIDSTDYNVAWIDNYSTALKTTVKNQTGSTLLKGTVVYVASATGANILVEKAQANAESTSSQTFGFLEVDIANGSTGFVINQGTLSGIDTSAYNEGDPVFLSPTVAGGWVAGLANKPYAPSHLVYLGVITRSQQNNGVIAVKVQNGYELDELHNVSARTPTTGQTIVYDAATGLWEKNTVSLTAGVNGVLPIANGGTNASTAAGALSNLGAYPASNPNGYTSNTGTVTSVAATAGTGISVIGSPITTNGTLTITNTAPDQTVAIASGSGISVTGTYPNFTVTNTSPSSGGTVTSVSGTGTVNGLTLTGTVTSSGNLTLGGTLNLSSPPVIGNVTPNEATFTTLSTIWLTATGQTSLGTGSANFIRAAGAETTVSPQILFTGSDTNVSGILATKGAGSFLFRTNGTGGNDQFRVTNTASAVNFVQVTGAATGGRPTISSSGSDTNIGLNLTTKGTGAVSLNTGGGEQFRVSSIASADSAVEVKGGSSVTGGVYITAIGTARSFYISSGANRDIRMFTGGEGTFAQLRVSNTASAVNFVQVTGAATGTGPLISAHGSDANAELRFQSKGTGSVNVLDGGGFNSLRVLQRAASGDTWIDVQRNVGFVDLQAASGVANGDIRLTPKGTGLVRFGTYTATVSAITGYIEIKDSGGTVRRLAVVA